MSSAATGPATRPTTPTGNADRDDAASEARVMRVVPFVRDTKNALVMRFEPARSGPETASLQAAFKQAIQREFQLEPRELACEPMPSRGERLEIFFHEVSEGGAGVLRRLVEDPAMLPALRPASARDLPLRPRHPRGPGRRPMWPEACYECLLDYGQPAGPPGRGNRELIRDFLAELARAECIVPPGVRARGPSASPRCAGVATAGSRSAGSTRSTPSGLRLPSDAQYRIPGYPAQPDFFYRDANAAIYVDGPPHDAPHQVRDDEAATEALMDMGYIVLRLPLARHHRDDWPAIFRRHQDLFGTPVE